MTLPKGWAQAKISDIASLNPKHPPETDISQIISFVPMPSVDEHLGAITDAVDRELREVWTGYTHFADGDVIFAKITPCMENGKAAVASGLTNGLGCGSTEFFVFRPRENISPYYLWRFLRQDSFRSLAETQMTGAVGQRRVPRSFLEDSVIPLPPTAEQRRIVAKLDALTACIARARADLVRVLILVQHLRENVLLKAFEDASVQRILEKTISALCVSVTDGDHQAPPKSAEGVPFITIAAMNRGEIHLSKATRFVPESYYSNLKPNRKPQSGDVLYSVTGSIGIPALVRGDEAFVFQRHIAILRPDKNICDPEWLSIFMDAPQFREQARKVATGTAQLTIPLNGLRNFLLPQLTLEEQRAQVIDIKTKFSHVELLEAEAARARALLDRLEAAIITKAFRGELVPQDPNDEPASVLLERIRAERAAAPKPKRGRRAVAS